MNKKNCQPNEERLLVKRAKKNNKHFGKLYTKYKDKIFGYILKKVNSPDVAEDLTSVTFEKALKNINHFQWQGISFGSWLFKIARNTVYDHFRVSKEDRKYTLDDRENNEEDKRSLEAQILHDEKELDLFRAISQFDKEDQYLLYYKYFVGLQNTQIADKTGLSDGNVATKLFRLRKKLRKILGEEYGELP